MASKNDSAKVVVAVVLLAIAAGVIAWQLGVFDSDSGVKGEPLQPGQEVPTISEEQAAEDAEQGEAGVSIRKPPR